MHWNRTLNRIELDRNGLKSESDWVGPNWIGPKRIEIWIGLNRTELNRIETNWQRFKSIANAWRLLKILRLKIVEIEIQNWFCQCLEAKSYVWKLLKSDYKSDYNFLTRKFDLRLTRKSTSALWGLLLDQMVPNLTWVDLKGQSTHFWGSDLCWRSFWGPNLTQKWKKRTKNGRFLVFETKIWHENWKFD